MVTATPPAPGRPLVRPIAGRQIAGVCLGMAQANGWNVTTIRILTVGGFLLTSGLVGIAYLAGWIGIPEETAPFAGTYPAGVPGYPPAGYPPTNYPPNQPGGYPPSV